MKIPQGYGSIEEYSKSRAYQENAMECSGDDVLTMHRIFNEPVTSVDMYVEEVMHAFLVLHPENVAGLTLDDAARLTLTEEGYREWQESHSGVTTASAR